jgi:myosin-1
VAETAADGTRVIRLAPGETAPPGATVVTLDAVVVAGSPDPGAAIIGAETVNYTYVYLQPGQTPPPGAIVRYEGSIAAAPSSGGSSGGSSAVAPAATPKPAPAATPKPRPVPPPPATKPSGG